MANPYFNAEYYLSQNPDVFAAGINTAEGAWEHYVNFGAAEALNGATSRKPAPWFDTAFYLAANPDLNTAGLEPGQLFDHFTAFGIGEGRDPNAVDNVDAATMSAYALANSDVADALGVEDPADLTEDEVTALAQHFYAFGYNEDRPGKPYDPSDLDPDPNDGQTFTLTDKIGENVVGTDGDDTFNAVLGATGAAADSTLNLADNIDGLAGRDTLNLTMSATNTALPAGVSIRNVEVVNVNVGTAAAGTSGVLNSTTYAGVQELWQIDSVTGAGAGQFGATTVGQDVVAGFRSTGLKATASTATATVTAATGATSVEVALDGVGDTSDITFAAVATVKTATVNGSVTQNATTTANTLTVTPNATTETLNLGLTSNTDVTVTATAALKTADLSASTGNITAALDNATFAKLATIKGGSGNDTLTVDLGLGATNIKVDGGAGSDTIIVEAANTIADGKGEVALGAGKDTVKIGAAGTVVNVTAAPTNATELTSKIVTVTDFSTAEDVLDLNGQGLALTSGQLTTIAGAADLLAAANAVAAILAADAAAATEAAVFNYGGDAYVLIDDDASGTVTVGDGFIKLAGVDASEFTNVQNGNLVL